jgi:hypothetical protein
MLEEFQELGIVCYREELLVEDDLPLLVKRSLEMTHFREQPRQIRSLDRD